MSLFNILRLTSACHVMLLLDDGIIQLVHVDIIQLTHALQVLGMALHHNVLVEHSFATFFLQAILNRRTTVQGASAATAAAAAAVAAAAAAAACL